LEKRMPTPPSLLTAARTRSSNAARYSTSLAPSEWPAAPTNPTPSACATSAPKMKPRASMPATAWTLRSKKGRASCSTQALNPLAWPSKVVMSRNMMPGLG